MKSTTQVIGWTALAIVGVAMISIGLVGLPFLRPTPLGYPESITLGDPHHAQLVESLLVLDRAADVGDASVLRSLLTERYHDELQARLAALGGGRLDRLTLHEQFGFLGFATNHELLVGRGHGSRAVLVYFVDLDPAGVDRAGVRGRLRAFVFDGGDGTPRLDRKLERDVRHGMDPSASAVELAAELLG